MAIMFEAESTSRKKTKKICLLTKDVKFCHKGIDRFEYREGSDETIKMKNNKYSFSPFPYFGVFAACSFYFIL